MYRLGTHRLETYRTFEEACEEERLPREEELLMESVEAESSFSCDSRVATLLIESWNIGHRDKERSPPRFSVAN
jgi:hypothetical protein